jgi:hypothetical protein
VRFPSTVAELWISDPDEEDVRSTSWRLSIGSCIESIAGPAVKKGGHSMPGMIVAVLLLASAMPGITEEQRDRPFQQLLAAPDHRPEFYVGGQARDAAAAAMGAGSPSADTPVRGPTFIADNPLRNLPPLPKAHHSCQGIDGAYLAHNSAVNPKGTNTSNPPAPRKLSNATGALPPPHPGAPLDGVVAPATVSMELVVQILLNASALHPQQRLGHLYVVSCLCSLPFSCGLVLATPLASLACSPTPLRPLP